MSEVISILKIKSYFYSPYAVVVLTLFLNNLFIFLNSLCLLFIIIFSKLSVSYWEPLLYTLSVLLVIFGSVARLTSLGTNISVEKDWVVVIAHKDQGSLARKETVLIV